MAYYYTINCLDDTPAGIKIIENQTQSIKGVFFKREQLQKFQLMQEAHQTGVYLLYNMQSEYDKPKIYIGQTDDIWDRLNRHNHERDFWNTAIAFVEKDNGMRMNSAHTKAIESLLIAKAKECGTAELDNETGSNMPRLQDSDKYITKEWAQQMVTIIRLLNLPFFDVDTTESPRITQNESCKKQTQLCAVDTESPHVTQNESLQVLSVSANTRVYEKSRIVNKKPKYVQMAGKRSAFESWSKTFVNQVTDIIEEKGIDGFGEQVIDRLFIGTRKTFAKSEDEMAIGSYKK